MLLTPHRYLTEPPPVCDSLRRARLGLDTESATSGSSKRPTPPPAPRPSSGGARKHADSESGPGGSTGGGKAGFARSDGGRYSLRMANGSTKVRWRERRREEGMDWAVN